MLQIDTTTTLTLTAAQWASNELAVKTIDQSATVVNRTDGIIYYSVADTVPANVNDADGVIFAGETLSGVDVYNQLHLYAFNSGVADVTINDNTLGYAPFHDALLTGDRNGKRRLRVEPGNAGFYEGREFRTFKAYTIPAGGSTSIKFNFPVNTIVQGVGLQVDNGHVHLETFTEVASESGFNTQLPIISTNRMTERPKPYYQNQVTIADGGTFTGGVQCDLISVKTVTNSNQSSTQDAVIAGERGAAPGDLYMRITNQDANNAATVLFRARWEERP